jgi:hypothetical protein
MNNYFIPKANAFMVDVSNLDSYEFSDKNIAVIPTGLCDDKQINIKLFAKTGVLSKEDVRQMAIHYGLISNVE